MLNAPTLLRCIVIDSGIAIFSAGDLAIGGSLDASHRATGQADTVNNISAGIEALGDLSIAAGTLNNQRSTFSSERQYDPAKSSTRSWTRCDDPPDCDYISYLTDQTSVYKDVVTSTSPAAFIRAGGNMALAVTTLSNQYSTIAAGGNLDLVGSTLTNLGAELFEQTDIIHSGYYRHWGRSPKGFWSSSESSSVLIDSVPAVISAGATLTGSYTGRIDNITLREHTAPLIASTGTRIAALGIGSITEVAAGAGAAGATIRTVTPNTTLPSNSLFHTSTSPTATYLIETDPKFASYRAWLSSDYMLKALSLDPAITQKRLGDGFYEQRLITEQVGQLTGRRFLTGYANEEDQYRALMDAGVTYAQAHQLRPGVALSAEQMAALTTDIVWLVEKQVTLADGRTQKVLVPQLYARLQEGDLAPSGALLAGNTINLATGGDLTTSGTIAGRQLVSLTAENIKNLGGRISGQETLLTARQDIQSLGGTIEARDRLVADAGRNLTVASSTVDLDLRYSGKGGSATLQKTVVDRVAGLYVTGPGGTLIASAGNDLNLLGAVVANNAAPTATSGSGSTLLVAGNNLNVGTVSESSHTVAAGKKSRRVESSSSEVGSVIQTSGDLTLAAGNDLTARAANVGSDGAILAQAGRDISVTAGQASYDMVYDAKSSKSGFLSKSTKTRHDEVHDTSAIASTLSGDSVTLVAGRDIGVKGSNVVATNDTTLIATRNLTIEAATETHSETHLTKTSKSGAFTSGASVTFGSRKESVNQQTESTTAAKSTIGSTDGNVLLLAGEAYKQVGSDVIAPRGSIDIAAKKVDIVEARETSKSTTETKFKQSGLTVAVSSPVITAVQTIQHVAENAPRAKDPRLEALAAATTGLAAKNAADAIAADPMAGGGVGLSVTVGNSKSSSTTTQSSNTAVASNLTAGRDITIDASGAGSGSDLTVRGSNLSASRNITLSAEDEIRLLAANNTSDLERRNNGSSAGIGVAVTYGSNGFAAGITANASTSKGKADGQDTSWSNTRVEAGNLLALESGGDTTLKGAVASGKQVVADIGGNFSIESLQDTSTYKRRDTSVGGSVTVGYGFAASANIGQQKIDSDFASVTSQSGIQAGDGGFDIRVKQNTDLKGAVIASSGQAVAEGRNRLETGTLTVSDIKNKAEYEASSVNLGVGYSQGSSMVPLGDNKGPAGGGVGTNQQGQTSTGGQTPGSLLPDLGGFSAGVPGTMSAKDDAKSTTQSGISAAVITITNEEKQQALTGKTTEQTLASLNRDVATGRDTTNALKPIFDEQKIEAQFAIVGAFSREMGTFLINRGKEADAKKAEAEQAEQRARDPGAPLSDEQRLQLLDQARTFRNEAQSITDNWGAGGTYRQIATALTAAATGNVGAASSEFAKNMLVNYVQQQGASYIGKLVADGTLTEGSPLHAALHGIVACAGAAASSQSCGTGALGAAASSLLTGLFSKTNPNETNAEREARRNLIVSIVTGIGAATGQAATATNAAVAAVDNNWLATQQIVQMKKELAAATNILEIAKVTAKWAYVSGKQDVLTAAGIGKGLAESGWSDVKGLAEFLADPVKGLQGIKDVISKPEVRAQLGEQIFGELDAKIGRMKTALNEGGDQNAEQLGKDLGALVWQVGSVATGTLGVAKGGVMLAKAGVNFGSHLLENAAYQFMKLDAGAINAFKSAEEINALMKSADWAPAWKQGTAVAETTIKPGTRVKMVVDEKAWNEIGRGEFDRAFGGWATFDDVPTQAYARNQLAITRDMKPNAGYVIEVEITKPINAQVGVVGAQGSAVGGGNQLHFVIQPADRANVFKVVGGRALP